MKFSLRLFVLIAALTALGCGGGDKRVALSGKVTVGGKGPLTGGNIRFVSTADPNRVGGGLIKADGTYEVTDAPVGACKVVIDNTHLDPNAVKAVNLPGMGGPGMKGVPGAPPGIKMPGGAGGPTLKDSDKAKMAGPPKGADIPDEMGAKSEASGSKYTKIEAGYAKADTTSLTFDVPAAGGTKDFDVK